MRRAVAVALALAAGSSPVVAAEFWAAMVGDSITEGCCGLPNTAAPWPGYPERLARPGLMNCTYLHGPDPAGDASAMCFASDPFPACAVVRPTNCVIANRGVSLEKTGGSLTRIQMPGGVLDEWNWDVLVYMGGTNDIFAGISATSVRQTIETIEQVVVAAGVDFVATSIIEFHPTADYSNPLPLNSQAGQLRAQLITMASTRNRYLSDQWNRICPPEPNLDFHGHTRNECLYWEDYSESATVGHPSEAGYDNMADGFLQTLTQKAVPGAVAPSTPVGQICGNPPSLSWVKEPGETANWYRVEIDGGTYDEWHQEVDWAGPDLCQPDTSGDDTCSLANPLSLGSGNHSWRVRGRNPGGLGPWTATQSFEIVVSEPSLATPTAPSGDVLTATPTYEWTEAAGAAAYDLEVFDGASWVTAGTFDASVCSGSLCRVTPAAPVLTSGERKFRVRAGNACGSAWSSELAFMVYLSPPASPVLIYPLQDVFDDTPTFRWRPSADATSYDFEVDDGATTMLYDLDSATYCSGGRCEIDHAVLAIGPYTWRVRAGNPFGDSAWSGGAFDVLACTPPDLQVVPTTLPPYRACVTVYSDPAGLTVGDVREFHAGEVVELHNLFTVGAGGELTVRTDY